MEDIFGTKMVLGWKQWRKWMGNENYTNPREI